PDPQADPVADARSIVAELKKFSPELAAKPRWLVINKCDLLLEEEAERRAREIVRRLRHRGPRFLISGATGAGTRALCEAIMRFLDEQAAAERERAATRGDTGDGRRA
ncbi:MAG: GTPase ObgE, partial [Steroidobacteraceae bacterium]